jgi:hypothetical protein
MEQLLDIIIISLIFILMAFTIAGTHYLRKITNQIKKENEKLSELNPNNRL